MRKRWHTLFLLVSLTASAPAADFDYTTNYGKIPVTNFPEPRTVRGGPGPPPTPTRDGVITITKYVGSRGDVIIPRTINGHPVAIIGDSAFRACATLTNVSFPDTLTRIDSFAFSGCTALTSLTIPKGVISISPHAFNYTAVAGITVDVLNPAYSGLDGVLFNKARTTLVQCPPAKAGNYTVPDTVTAIELFAFHSRSRLTSVTIGRNVTNIQQMAFANCYALTNVALSGSLTRIGCVAFGGCTRLTSITIPESVTIIDSAAFAWCTGLTNIYFEGSAPSTDHDVFMETTNVTVLYRPGTSGWGPTFAGRPTAPWKP
jgi:hypothetical protein